MAKRLTEYADIANGSLAREIQEEAFVEFALARPDLIDKVLKIRREASVRDSRFDINLAEGHYAEGIVKEILQGDKTIEVKLDERAPETGNLLIEYAKYNKPTGISVSQADWYAFVLGGKLDKEVVVMVKTARLKRLIDEYGKSNPASGTGDKSQFVLLSTSDVVKEVK